MAKGTGISEVRDNELHDTPVYNLQGQQLRASDISQRGIYIRAGKKIVVR